MRSKLFIVVVTTAAAANDLNRRALAQAALSVRKRSLRVVTRTVDCPLNNTTKEIFIYFLIYFLSVQGFRLFTRSRGSGDVIIWVQVQLQQARE